MKKSLCILLAFVLLTLCATPMALAADTDKISPALRALIEENTEGGVVVEIFHHNADYPTDGVSEQEAVQNNLQAHKELLAQIEEITYMEADGFSIGRFYIGLPYESIEKVAALENVDYIDLPHDEGSPLSAQEKPDDRTKTALEKLSPDTKVSLTVWFAYNEHAYIGMADPGENGTSEQVQEYLRAMRAAKRNYITAKNEAYVQIIKEKTDVEIGYTSRYTPMASLNATLGEVEKIAALKEVATVYFNSVILRPSEDPDSLSDKFAVWMYETKGFVANDPELEEQGLLDLASVYTDYREVCEGDGWALVYAENCIREPWEYVEHIALGNRVLSWYAPGAAVYPYGYFVYNAKEDTFHPIERFVYPTEGAKDENGKYIKYISDPVILPDDYPGLIDALDEYNVGAVRGDADGDGKRTVLDATVIQRYKADMIAETGLDVDAADADGDNETTVLDATRIQRTIADLCDITGELKVLNPLF